MSRDESWQKKPSFVGVCIHFLPVPFSPPRAGFDLRISRRSAWIPTPFIWRVTCITERTIHSELHWRWFCRRASNGLLNTFCRRFV